MKMQWKIYRKNWPKNYTKNLGRKSKGSFIDPNEGFLFILWKSFCLQATENRHACMNWNSVLSSEETTYEAAYLVLTFIAKFKTAEIHDSRTLRSTLTRTQTISPGWILPKEYPENSYSYTIPPRQTRYIPKRGPKHCKSAGEMELAGLDTEEEGTERERDRLRRERCRWCWQPGWRMDSIPGSSWFRSVSLVSLPANPITRGSPPRAALLHGLPATPRNSLPQEVVVCVSVPVPWLCVRTKDNVLRICSEATV